ncbi:MAG: glycosyltransferase [Cyanobacteriota bacterium]|nr:glycosyltransferase [Cyanobacteriota bacterium]
MAADLQGSLVVFAPTRQAASETFIRANLAGLPFRIRAWFGDERPLDQPLRCLYGTAILLSKLLTRLRLLRLAGVPAALVAWLLLRLDPPDVVLAEFGFEAVRVMEACSWAGVPFVVHFRGSDASARNRIGLLAHRYRRLFTIAGGVIVKSRAMARRLEALGAARERLLISPSGANAELFYGAVPAQAKPIFLAVGRFVAKKGPLQTLEAFRRCLQQAGSLQAAELWMIGEGPLLPFAQRYVEQHGLQQQVRFEGAGSQALVAERMREVRAFVQHSQVAPDGDSEGSPVAVMEAQLSGLPVVATRHAGIPEVVVDGSTGLLVDEGDVAGMAEAMLLLLLDPALAHRLGSAGQRRVKAHFTVEQHLQDITDLLLRVQAKPAPRDP